MPRSISSNVWGWSRPGGWDDESQSQPSGRQRSSPEAGAKLHAPLPPPPPPGVPRGMDEASAEAGPAGSGCPVQPQVSAPSTFRAESTSSLPASVIHLDFFSGIGSATLALGRLGISVRCVLSWEIDAAAIKVARKASRKTIKSQRGSILDDSPAAVAEAIEQVHGGAADLLVITAAAPCPDFSRIRANGPGRTGSSGSLFVKFTEFLGELLNLLPGRRACLLAENVQMQNPADIQWFCKAMHAEVVLADAADYGAIHRPRLWWSWTDWTSIRQYPGKASTIRWQRHGKLPRIHLEVTKDDLADVQPTGLVFHDKVHRGEVLLPCLTTPAVEESGREAPKSLKGKIDSVTRARWIEGKRQWAPWFFADTAMLRDCQAKLHLLPIETKEALHHYDRDYSSDPSISVKDRHRLLGNSWHLGVATEMLKFSILFGVRSLPGPHAPGALDVSGLRDLASAEKMAGEHPLSMQRQPEMCDHIDMQPASDMWDHWHFSALAVHPLFQRPQLDPAIEVTLQRLLRFPPERLDEFRGSVLRDIAARKVEMQSITDTWYASLQPHVQRAYRLPDGMIVQIPLFMSLLRGCGYPDVDSLEQSLSSGFPVLGHVDPAPGWRPRLDDRYDHPISMSAFRVLNEAYVSQKLQRGRVDPEWETLLSEVLTEVKLGRMSGPYNGPGHWPRRCVPVSSHSGFDVCLDAEDNIHVATAFSVVQQGSDGSRKVRRCEDYRRSGHNSTIHVQDIPAHDDIHRYVQILLRLEAAGHETEVWCQDLWAAYRQFPVSRPNDAFALILTPSGPSLWRHGVLPFGAASSVWCFNRCVDALTFLARSLLLILLIHFVDDIGCPDSKASASSSFHYFSALCELLGLRLKPSKAQPPATKHKLLGVILEITERGIRLSPAPDRVSKVLAVIQTALRENSLEPVTAQKLAGKLNFLCSTLFGQAAASAMKPLYARAHDRNSQEIVQLNQPLRFDLHTVRYRMRCCASSLHGAPLFTVWRFLVRSSQQSRAAMCLRPAGSASATMRLASAHWFGAMAVILRSITCWPASGRSLRYSVGNPTLNGSRVTSTLQILSPEGIVLSAITKAGPNCALILMLYGQFLAVWQRIWSMLWLAPRGQFWACSGLFSSGACWPLLGAGEWLIRGGRISVSAFKYRLQATQCMKGTDHGTPRVTEKDSCRDSGILSDSSAHLSL